MQNRREEKIATRTDDILCGRLHVPDLSMTPESLGDMTMVCEYCGAYKFKRETSSLCCLNGKVELAPFPTPPPVLMDLWYGETHADKVFQQNCRSINNAVSLSSLAVTERTFSRFTPSLIFQGRVTQRMGPIHAEALDMPMFAQLYVLDSNLERSTRHASLTVGERMSPADKIIMENHLDTVQVVIHDINPFVRDFKQIVEMPEEELQMGKIVISADSAGSWTS